MLILFQVDWIYKFSHSDRSNEIFDFCSDHKFVFILVQCTNWHSFSNDFQSVVGGGATVYSPSIATFRNTFRDDTMQSRMGRTTAGETLRPMTAIAGAGFQSQSKLF